MAYAGYQGYDPELDRLEQRRNIAQALQQGALETGPKSLPEGIAQIGKALMARQAMKKADKAGAAYDSNQKKIAEALGATFFGERSDPSKMAYPESPAPLSDSASAMPTSLPTMKPVTAGQPLTPPPPPVGGADMSMQGQTPPTAAVPPKLGALTQQPKQWTGFTPEQQTAGRDRDQYSAMIAMGMNPMEAAQIVKGQARQRLEDERYAAEQNKPTFLDTKGGVARVQNDTVSMELPYTSEAKPSVYNEVTLSDGVYSINQNDPTDKIRIGDAPKKDGGGPLDPNDPERIRLEREFSKDWKTVQSDYDGIDRQYNNIAAMVRQARSNPQDASAADLALIVGFTKLQDPGTVAMPGEVQLSQQTVGIVQQANNMMNTWENGKTILPDDVRRNILAASTELHRVYQDAYQKRGAEYNASAQSYGFDPRRTLIGYKPSAPEQPKAAVVTGSPFNPMAATGQVMQQAIQDAMRQALTGDLSQFTDEQLERIGRGQ